MSHKIAMALDLPNNKVLEVVHISSKTVESTTSDIQCDLYLTGEGELITCSLLEGHDFITVIPSNLEELLEGEEFSIECGEPNNYSWGDYKKNIVGGNKGLIEELAIYQREDNVAIEELIPILHRISNRITYTGDVFK